VFFYKNEGGFTMKQYDNKAIIFSDLDGTALHTNHKFSARLKKVVKQLYCKGIYFCPITARSTADAIAQAKKLKLDRFGGIVAGNNGSQIYDFKNNVWVNNVYIPNSVVAQVFEKTFMKIGQYKCHFFADDETFVYGPGDNSRYWSDVMHVKYNVVASLDMITKPITHLTIILSKSATPADIKNFYKEFNDLNENIDIIQYTKRVYEVCVKGINKGFAVEKICEYLGIDKTKTKSYAFGDSHNDFELFSSSDYGIAMGNALPELYEEADFITNTNDEDGVANYIEKKILKGE
jgi:Cof subfamily protein (haloacid dehalogenase superfamily)